MVPRKLEGVINQRLGKGKAVIVMGARQTGKTTLLHKLFSGDGNALWLNGDDADTHAMFDAGSARMLQTFIGNHKTVIVDEAQRIENIGIKLKLITDQMKDVQLVVTGSSSFELANKINEPLTGRKWEYMLFPLSFGEMAEYHGAFEEMKLLNHRLVYGYYPEVVMHENEAENRLKSIADSFLYKDVLHWENIKKSGKLLMLLKALAFQVGQEVSYNELGKTIGLDKETVEKYIQLLEQSFVIFRLTSLSRNLRKELKKSRKIYFYDNGIRNALLSDFRPANNRQDIGGLWENFLISERKKQLHYNHLYVNTHFWRTHDQQEIDYIEERNGVLHAFEFKWNPKKKARLSKSFSNAYPNHSFKIINPENFVQWLMGDDY